MKRALTIAGLVVVGLALPVGLTMAASQFTSQSIGISGEPVTAGEQLAIPDASPTADQPRARPASDQPVRPGTRAARDPSAAAGDDVRDRDDVDSDDRDDSGSDDRGSDDSGSDDSGSDDSGDDD